jgi:hypothetical protein
MSLGKTFFLLILLFSVIVCNAQETNENPKETIVKAFKKTEESKYLTEEMIAKNDRIPSLYSIIVSKYVAPDRFQTIWTTSKGQEVMQIISIGDSEYSKENGIWKKENGKASKSFDKLVEGLIENFREKYILNVKKLGSEKIGEVNTSLYEYEVDLKSIDRDVDPKSSDLNLDFKEEMKVKVWINDEGFVLKTESVRKSEGLGMKEILRQFTTYNYDVITIEPPVIKPIKKSNKSKNN